MRMTQAESANSDGHDTTFFGMRTPKQESKVSLTFYVGRRLLVTSPFRSRDGRRRVWSAVLSTTVTEIASGYLGCLYIL